LSEVTNRVDEVYNKYINLIEKVNETESIYHYTSPSGFLGILDNKALWFTDSDFLNDSSESEYFHDTFSSVIPKGNGFYINKSFEFKSYFISSLHANAYHDGKMTYERKREFRYLASFSTDGDNLSLWNYYTKTPTKVGYNFGINLKPFINSIIIDSGQRLMHGKVIYDRKVQESILSNMIEEYTAIYKLLSYTYQRNYLFEKLEDNIVYFSMFMKNEAFASENEYRIAIITISDLGKQDVLFRENGGIFIPFIEKPFDINSINRIGISPTNRSKFAEQSIQKLKIEREIDAEVFLSEIPLRY